MANITKPDFSNGLWASGGATVAPSNVKIQTGWTAEVPPYQWENYTQLRQDQGIAHILQHGISVWDVLTEYQGNSSYTQGSNGLVYKAVQTNTGQNPVTDTSNTYWIQALFGRLLRTSVYSRSGGVQVLSVNGSSPSTTGATTFTPLSSSLTMVCEVQGGGGGGGATTATGTSTLSCTGGGQGGAYGMGMFTAQAVNILVGVGGTGGAVGPGTGGNGTSSTIGALMSAPGGTGSLNQTTASTSAGLFGGTGLGPAATGANIYMTRGGPGLYGLEFAGISPACVGGAGGSTKFGPGATADSAGPANNGVNYGTGGSGAASTVSTAGRPGGAGADGIIIIREYA